MANPVIITSTIEAVQVYRRAATVIRRAVVEGATLASGAPASIELVGLPLCMTDATAKVSITAVEPATARVTATGLAVGVHVRPGTPPEKAPEQRELEDIAWRINEAAELERLLTNEIDLLTSIPVPDRPMGEDGRAPPPAPLAMRLALEGFVDDAAEARRLERRQLQTKLRALRLEQAAMHERIAAASTASAAKISDLSKSIVVPLRVDGAPSKFVVEVRYVVPGARWAPAYHVKLARDGSTATIHQRAFIQQASGEDWSNVRLKLSTASPLRYGELPELPSVRIGKAQPPPQKKGFRPPPKGGVALFADYDRDAGIVQRLIPAPRPWQAPTLSVDVVARVSAPPSPPRARHKGGGGVASAKQAMMRDEGKASMLGASLSDEDSVSDDMMYEAEESTRSVTPAAPAAARAAPAPSQSSRREMQRSAPPMPRGGVDEVVDAITFPLLRLPGPTDGSRGRLLPVNLADAYQESAQRGGRPVPFSVKSAVDVATEAAQLSRSAVPPLCVDIQDMTSNFDFAYEGDGVVDVSADGHWHSVPLGDRECGASIRYITVPREELAVYRIAVIQNALGAPLLAGPAEVYVGGEFVLTTQLPTVVAKGELTLGLGVEQAIKVARNARFKEVREGEGVVAMVELVHDVDVDIVNHLGRSIDIEVRERVPITEPGAEVQISERNVEPAWEAYDQEERSTPIAGGRRWRVKVDAGSTKALRACYALRLFSNSELKGGNRREA